MTLEGVVLVKIGGSNRWSKVHNIIKGVILSFTDDLNFFEIQYFLYIVG